MREPALTKQLREHAVGAKLAFDGFRADHVRHAAELAEIVAALGGIPTSGPDEEARHAQAG